MTSSSSIAVIVTAFNRRNYFAEAVESALRAAAGPGGLECLLLRNFEDPKVDPRLVERGVHLVPDDSPDVGGTLCCALDHSDAEFFAFVDDDDLIHPERFLRFAQILRQVPDLAYYHNGYTLFSFDALDSTKILGGNSLRGSAPWRTFHAEDGDRFLRFLARKNRDQNMSSTIIRRSVLENSRAALSVLPAMSDTMMLFVGILSQAPLVFDDEVTTYVRRHSENVSRNLSDTRRRAEALKVFSRMIALSPSAAVARDHLELRRAREVVYTRVLGVPSSSSETRAAVRELLDSWKRLHVWRDIGFLGIGGAALTVPTVLPALRPLLVPK